MSPTELLVQTQAGLYCPLGAFYIDPVRPVARALVTHAHSDHARSGHEAVLATAETLDLMRLRYGEDFAGTTQAVGYGETVRLDGDLGEKLARSAVAKGGVAIGTALIVPGDEAVVARIREASDSFGGEVGISAWNGFAMARFCAQDAARLRADMMTVLGRASGAALPRLWLN